MKKKPLPKKEEKKTKQATRKRKPAPKVAQKDTTKKEISLSEFFGDDWCSSL